MARFVISSDKDVSRGISDRMWSKFLRWYEFKVILQITYLHSSGFILHVYCFSKMAELFKHNCRAHLQLFT